MICLVSLTSYAEEVKSDIDYYLPLPQFKTLEIADSHNIAVDQDGLKALLRIYATYQTLGLYINKNLKEETETLKTTSASYKLSLVQCQNTLSTVDVDRRFIYRIREAEKNKAKVEQKAQRLKFILLGTGGGVVALAAGLLIGFIAF